MQNIIVIGGGAAGFFGAITCARACPGQQVYLIEKTGKLLSKVRVSGGGRCNVTHHCFSPARLVQHYPRGGKQLKNPFTAFGPAQTIEWFESRGVKLKTEADGRMFPVTDSSETIIDCLMQQARDAGVKILTGTPVEKISPGPEETERWELHLADGKVLKAKSVLICTGGAPKPESYHWLAELGHTIVPPVPSLFTFNVPNSPLQELMGISVPQARVKVAGQKLEQEGPLLITHWGFSGPAVLKTSAWGARLLHDLKYNFTILINWIPEFTEDSLRQYFMEFKKQHPLKVIQSNTLFGLPNRLWKMLVQLAEIGPDLRWADVSNKSMNKLLENLLRAGFQVKGKTTFKEEFVTCGGISLAEVNMQTMESRLHKGLYFAGEVLDIDGVTGGFNFQAAWTTGYLAGKAMAADK